MLFVLQLTLHPLVKPTHHPPFARYWRQITAHPLAHTLLCTICSRNGRENHSICERIRRRKWKDVEEFWISIARSSIALFVVVGWNGIMEGTWTQLNSFVRDSSVWKWRSTSNFPLRPISSHHSLSFYSPHWEKGIWWKFISIFRPCLLSHQHTAVITLAWKEWVNLHQESDDDEQGMLSSSTFFLPVKGYDITRLKYF